MKGGYRPGSGRPYGAKDSKPRKMTTAALKKTEMESARIKDEQWAAQVEAEQNEQAEQIKQLLTIGQKARLKFYQEFLIRAANKDKKQKPLSVIEMRMMEKIGEELAEATKKEKEEITTNNLEAGEYLYQVWNDPNIDLNLRIRAAEIVFRVVGEKKGKKGEAGEKAKSAGAGKFKMGRSPLAVVK